MSQQQSSPPPDYFPPDTFAYQSASPYGNAPALVKVDGILNLVMAGIDLLYSLILLTVGILILSGVIPKSEFDDQPGPKIIGSIVSVVTMLPLGAGLVKLVAGVKLVRRSHGAWGWGLAGGIVGCTQLWCSYFCVLPMAIGIFTIVVMCLDNVRRYLGDSAVQA